MYVSACLPWDSCPAVTQYSTNGFRKASRDHLSRFRQAVQALIAVLVTLLEHFCTQARQLILSAAERAL